jgi:uncharacterized protein
LTSLSSDILIGLAFFFVIEGLVYALVPRLIKEMAKIIPEIPEERLRIYGVAVLAFGVLFVWMVKG